MTRPIVYSFRRCPYAMRARLALAVSATQIELREVKLAAKPEAMLLASPKGTVPVLVLPDGGVIDESIHIMRWALDRHDPEGWLARDDKSLIADNDGPFKRNLDRYKYPDRHGSDATAHRAEGLVFLQILENKLANTPYLSGNQRGLTDAAIMPFVRQFSAVDSGWFEMQDLPRLKQWLSDLTTSNIFTAIMMRLPPWRPHDEPVYIDWKEYGLRPQ
ncbi:MAG: glutathione S-transferase [Sphingobium sp.]|nr:glutathione S-transferase [Sphingobium sp.]